MLLQLLLACGLVGAVAAQEPASVPAASLPAAKESPLIRGSLASRYWLRWNANDHDHDLYETLSLDVGDPERHAVTGYFLGRLSFDLDGGEDPSSPYYSLADTYDHSINGYVYDAYADFHTLAPFARFRAGRQTIYETPEVAFLDGLSLESVPFGGGAFQIGGYAGVSTHLYESSPNGDWTFGVYLQSRPWAGGRLRLDWMHLEDEAQLGEYQDDLWSLAWWQTLAESLQLEAQYSVVEGDSRDVRARAGWTQLESELVLQASYYQLLHTQKDRALELDPFYDTLQEYYPFSQLGLLASKGIWEHFDVQLGADVRRVRDSADIGEFNRDYERWYVTGILHDVLVKGLAVSGTGDIWHSDEQDVESWGADVTQAIADRWSASIGTYYSLYKYDLYQNAERDNVRTYYVKLARKQAGAVTLDASYELEDNDFDDYHFLRLGMTWRF
jgi:hypothetical protein